MFTFTKKLFVASTVGILGIHLLGSSCASRHEAGAKAVEASSVATRPVAADPGEVSERSEPSRKDVATSEAGEAAPASAETSREVKLVTTGDFGVPRPAMVLDPERTAIVITDPQNDFLSPEGAAWGVVGASVTENRTVENIEALFKTAKEHEIPVFISPHYYYPHDHGWKFEGALEALMHDIHMFDRKDPLSVEGFEGSGADWLERYKPYIEDEGTIVSSPHKVYGPETNDLILQLRKRGVDKVILAGMSANLCTESHMRELLEQGFEVAVVQDATAGARTPAGDAYKAALANFRYMASAVVTTEEAVKALRAAFEGRAVASR